MNLRILLFSLGFLFCGCVSLNILVYSNRVGHSHTNFMGKIADTLAEAGHQVVFLQTVMLTHVSPSANPKKAEIITLDQSDYVKGMANELLSRGQGSNRWAETILPDMSVIQVLFDFMRRSGVDAVKRYVNDETLMKRLRDLQFDIAFTQTHEWSAFGLFYELGLTKYITLTSSSLGSGYPWMVGAPLTPSYVPAMHSRYGDKMNIYERFENLIVTYQERYLYCSGYEEMDEFMQSRHPEYPGSLEMVARSSYLLSNSEPLIDFPRPLVAKIGFIGGISIPPKGSTHLSQRLDGILNERKHTVFISFGSMTKSSDMPEHFKRPLISAMKRLPEITFLWKYENLEDEWTKMVSENVILDKWYPQLALLEDDRLSGFMTHSGAASLNELVARGKKAICVPLSVDQFAHARQLERLGLALYLSKQDLRDENQIVSAFEKLVSDKNLEENAKRVSKMLSKRPNQPKDVLINLTEYVAEFGPLTILTPEGQRLSFIQYYLLDIFFILFLIFILIILFIFLTIRCAFNCIYRERVYKRVPPNGKKTLRRGKH